MSNTAHLPEAATVQSVDRAARILELLAQEGWSGGAHVARALGTHRSTALRLLVTLERHGLVERDDRTARYRLGGRLSHLASAAHAELDLRREARPVCERLAERAGETVTLDVLATDEVVHIDQVTRSSSVVSVNWLGRHTPLHCTASGKVILALGPESLRRRALARPLRAYTPHTVVDPAALARQLAEVRVSGCGHTAEELEIGLSAVAAPVRGRDGHLVAAVDLSGPSHRLAPAALPELVRLTIEAAAELSRRLGAPAR